jgi:hypothetical protein
MWGCDAERRNRGVILNFLKTLSAISEVIKKKEVTIKRAVVSSTKTIPLINK